MLTEFIIIMFSFANSLSLWPKSQPFDGLTVAPHVGAWIEISVVEKRPIDEYVAPHVGAWIEIKTMLESGESFASHPTWVRGLKLLLLNAIVAQARSHPTWVRGLKCVGDPSDAHGGRRTPRGCVDWNKKEEFHQLAEACRTPRGCVDWNLGL